MSKKEIIEKGKQGTEIALKSIKKAEAMIFAKAIKRIREQTGLSQSKFAQKYNIPTQSVQNWEQGHSKPPEYVVDLLQRVVDIDYPTTPKTTQQG